MAEKNEWSVDGGGDDDFPPFSPSSPKALPAIFAKQISYFWREHLPYRLSHLNGGMHHAP